MNEALVKNAADENQVAAANKKIRFNRIDEIDDIKAILSTKNGRRFLWRIMTLCRTYESVWDNSAAIHRNAGRQDVGHWLRNEIIAADKNKYFEMQTENLKENGV